MEIFGIWLNRFSNILRGSLYFFKINLWTVGGFLAFKMAAPIAIKIGTLKIMTTFWAPNKASIKTIAANETPFPCISYSAPNCISFAIDKV